MSIIGSNILAGASGQADGAYLIERSLRFNDNDSASLTRTFSTNSSAKWTWSGWVKRCRLGANQALLSAGTYTIFGFNTLDNLRFERTSNATNLVTNAEFRDLSAWYHIVLAADSAQSTASDKVKLYVNGSQITSWSTATHGGPGTHINTNIAHSIGKYATSRYLDGYLAEVHFVDGEQLEASDFGEYDDNNVWQAKEYSGTHGSNGFYLDFSDNTSTSTIAEDSANSNDFTANNISVTAGSGNDSLFDSPTNGTQSDTGAGGEVSGNYATINPLALGDNITLSNGNLEAGEASTSGHTWAKSTIGVKSGKWYVEVTVDSATGANVFGLTNYPSAHTGWIGSGGSAVNQFNMIYNNGTTRQIFDGNVVTTNYISGSQWSTGDVLQIAYDADNDKAWFGINNTWYQANGSSTTLSAVEAGNNATFVNFNYSSEYFFTTNHHDAGFTYNFGQRPFTHSAPSGFKALCTANLPDPTIADGSTYFDVATWTGNGSTQSITSLSFQPDFLWYKSRGDSYHHGLQDSVRGVGKSLSTSRNDIAEQTETTGLDAFTSNGFDLDGQGFYFINTNNDPMVGWAWDAGSSTASNTDGSITTSVRANQTAGFSIVTGTTPATNTFTIGHGLNAEPHFIIVKVRNQTYNWDVYHKSLGNTGRLILNSTNASSTQANAWGSTTPTSSVFTMGGNGTWYSNGDTFVAYCFAPVSGYSAVGSYEGNNSSDGPFVFTGFRPKFILFKSTGTGDWVIIDSSRDSYNIADADLYPNASNAEGSNPRLDILSNGFKIRSTYSSTNPSSVSVTYAAFAENPFSSNGGLAR